MHTYIAQMYKDITVTNNWADLRHGDDLVTLMRLMFTHSFIHIIMSSICTNGSFQYILHMHRYGMCEQYNLLSYFSELRCIGNRSNQ